MSDNGEVTGRVGLQGSDGDQRVAIFVDVPNVWATGKEAGEQFDPKALMRAAREYGHVVVARAYAAVQWGRTVHSGVTELERAGFETVCRFVSPEEGYGKDIDTRLAVELVETAYEDVADTILLASADSDYVPALVVARRLGKRLILIQYGPNACERLAALADEIVTIPLAGASAEGKPANEATARSRRSPASEPQPKVFA